MTTTAPIAKYREDGTQDPRWTLGMEYAARGLQRPTQMRKHTPKDDRDKLEKVEFEWGATKVVGYRTRVSKPAGKTRKPRARRKAKP